MKNITIYIFSIICMLLLSCSGNRRVNHPDITTEGFITGSCFQAIIKGAPDKNKRGLVERRDSSLQNAQSKLPGEVLEKLVNYYLDHFKQKNNIKDNANKTIIRIKPVVTESVKKYLPNGYKAYSYYKENKSVVIVYRICSSNFKQELISMDILKKLQDKKE